MLDAALLRDWLNAVPLDLDVPFERGPRVREFGNADISGLVTMVPGPGELMDGVGDYSSFQVRLTSREANQEQLRKSAFQLDTALRFGDYPADLWGTWIVSVERTGGAPSELETDEHDRVSYVCTYNAFETI